MKFIITFILLQTCIYPSHFLDLNQIVIVVLSQANAYHVKLAKELRQDVTLQVQTLNKTPPIIHFAHDDMPHVGGWTVFPLVSTIIKLHEHNATWIVICQEITRFNVQFLLSTLEKYDHTKGLWLGHALHDREASIIHHFAFYNDPESFSYPNVASGFAVTMPLLRSVLQRLPTLFKSEIEFSIDASHELALFIWDEGRGSSLIDEPTFCIQKHALCASHVASFAACGQPIRNDNILFAVKTCKKFHKDRVPIVKKTWAKYVSRINFYSEEFDGDIPTVELGVANTERGHCGKTLAILSHAADEIRRSPALSWLIVTDDDTILSSRQLRRLLSCYNASEKIAIGERYGFKVLTEDGYNYITGGGGMVFSAALVHQLTAPGVCECPSNQSPDDMFLGVCLARLGINITHSPAFHQARPPDYASDYLASQQAVSFHKHWMLNPVSVYEEWFQEADTRYDTSFLQNNQHVEL